jgi:hypothetical protein
MSVTMPHYAKTSLLGLIGYGLHSAFRTLSEASHGIRCAREAQRLSALSDLDLARMGIRRDQIFERAFAPLRRA